MTRLARLLELGFRTAFVYNGELRELREPTGPPTGRQLLKLKIYAGAEHPHEAQSPTPLEVRD